MSALLISPMIHDASQLISLPYSFLLDLASLIAFSPFAPDCDCKFLAEILPSHKKLQSLLPIANCANPTSAVFFFWHHDGSTWV